MSVKHDWYQSEQKVVITVLMKNAEQKNYAVQIEPERVLMTATDYKLELELLKPINVERSSYKAFSTKVEITLGKVTGDRWETLEKKIEEKPAAVVNKKAFSEWDKVAKDVEADDEKNRQGEDALQSLFRTIYESSTEETRRAMNKSFQESGGTVLSTNWNEIGNKTTDIKPPDGVEFKTWDK